MWAVEGACCLRWAFLQTSPPLLKYCKSASSTNGFEQAGVKQVTAQTSRVAWQGNLVHESGSNVIAHEMAVWKALQEACDVKTPLDASAWGCRNLKPECTAVHFSRSQPEAGLHSFQEQLRQAGPNLFSKNVYVR